jgi:ABC-type transport system involved in Fe-S cluster assembly fused permease/ATPase subunit
MADMFTNIESIKYFGKENLVKSKFRALSEITKEKTIAFWRYYSKLDFIQSIILSAGTFFLVYFTIKEFMAGKYSMGTLVFIYTVFTGLMELLQGYG